MPPTLRKGPLTAQEEDEAIYGHGPLTKEELDEKFPNRPHNHSLTLPFHELCQTLFDHLDENRKKPTGSSRAKKTAAGRKHLTPHEARRAIVASFFSRWRQEVGDDIFPAMRLIIPAQDRDRGMYGLKEKNIGKVLVQICLIKKTSEDGFNLLNWKLPGQKSATESAGDFAGRCFEVISKRHDNKEVGDMRIGEVNVLLDKLSNARGENDQLPIFREFYQRMNAYELMWLIRIMLRQIKVGATEKTILNVWHPNGEALFSISSSLRRCCWELTDPKVILSTGSEGVSITLMECFQPQLAQFQEHDFKKSVDKLLAPKRIEGAGVEKRVDDTIKSREFWIEEKLDGERMQLHMQEDSNTPGGMKFRFWSRKATDYTALYGHGFSDENSSLTRYLKDAFHEGVENIILDGEMITWDPETDKMLAFGTLKSAALSTRENPYNTDGPRPLFRVFDILYLNDTPLTMFELRARRAALDQAVKDVFRRLEKHPFKVAYNELAIEPELRKVVANSSEGLVLKNPGAAYKLNDRNNDWMKVKPEYMTEFGESLDCVIIGGYYGSGRRGGRISSFLCGLRIDGTDGQAANANPEKCLSFFRVGGGFRAEDYDKIRHHTDGKWIDWDANRPPKDYIVLAGGARQIERPDVWIKPSDSVVISCKAASVSPTDQFAAGQTLRFPRFRSLRMDRTWDSALSVRQFAELKDNADVEVKEKKFVVEKKGRSGTKRQKKAVPIAGNDEGAVEYAGPKSELFEGLNFHIMSERTEQPKKSKHELEQIVKGHGARFFQSATAEKDMICIADKRILKVDLLAKNNSRNIVKSSWILDCIKQAEIDTGKPRFIPPYEPQHMVHTLDTSRESIAEAVDEFGDSFTRDVTADDLRQIVQNIAEPEEEAFQRPFQHAKILEHLDEELRDLPGAMFRGAKVYMDLPAISNASDLTPGQLRMQLASNFLRFGAGELVSAVRDVSATHLVVHADAENRDAASFRKMLSTGASSSRLPRIVTVDWIEDCWAEGTRLDEERFAPR